MADIHTIIKLRRTTKPVTHTDVETEKLEVGEPASIKSTSDEYLVIGEGNGKEIKDLKRFKAFNKGIVDNQVFYSGNKLTDEKGNQIYPATKAENVTVTYKGNTDTQSAITDLHVRDTSLEQRASSLEYRTTDLEKRSIPVKATNTSFKVIGFREDGAGVSDHYWYNANVEVTDTGVLKGAAWNDFAEYRDVYNEYLEPGTVVCECGNGVMERSVKRLQPGAAVISDTYGMIIGQDNEHSQPVAVAGRVLVNAPLDEEFKAGDPVCAGEFGMISKMNRLEVILFPDRILGYVSEIPDYDEWNGIKVGYRIWIKVK